MAVLMEPKFREQRGGLQLWTRRWGLETKDNRSHQQASPSMGLGELIASPDLLLCPTPYLGTIPPIKSAQGEGDDVKKLFTIGCPVILATLGVALLFVVRKKRKEKRLKRLRGGGLFYQLLGRVGGDSQPHWPPFGGP